MRCAGIVIAIACASVACGQPHDPPAQTTPALAEVDRRRASAETTAGEAWQRRRDCFNDAIRLLAMPEWKSNETTTVVAWESHYDGSRHACYANIHLLNRTRSKDVPVLTESLMDVLEHNEIAICAAGTMPNNAQVLFCSIKDDEKGAGNCDACRAFIDNRMRSGTNPNDPLGIR